jgi:hypothetical protein
MPSPLFNLFEMIAEELTLEESRVLAASDFDPEGNEASVLDELRTELKLLSRDEALKEGVNGLELHFKGRGSRLPFMFDAPTSRFTALDKDYLKFVTEIKEIRGQGKNSKEFELGAMERIKLRVAGALHRVGHPRTTQKKQKQFNAYLANIGFNGSVLLGAEKDGGLDILWVLPVGAMPHQALVSFQCKNGRYKLKDGDTSTGATKRSLNQHAGLMSDVHVMCVLFNDYITADQLPKKPMQWVPLGLSDLAPPVATAATSAAL